MPSPSFTPTTWVDESEPDITADELNRVEAGIEDAHERLDTHDTTLGSYDSRIDALETGGGGTSIGVGGRHHKNAKKRGAAGNGTTQDGAILQTLLDELAVAGGGELYLPNDGGTIYKTYGLWIPSNVRIVSDGAKIQLAGASPSARHNTGEPEDIYAVALTAGPWSQNAPVTISGGPENILLEGFTVIPELDGSRDINGNPVGCLAGICFHGVKDSVIRDVTVEYGATHEALQIGSRTSDHCDGILVERFIAKQAGRRNGAHIFDSRHVTLFASEISGADIDSPDDPFPPGAGIDFEGGGYLESIHLRDCTIKNNASAGLLFSNEDTFDSIKDILIEGCIIEDNGQEASLPGGATFWAGINFQVISTATPYIFRVVNCHVVNNLRGPSIKSGTSGGVVLLGNDLRPASGQSATSISGNDTARSITDNNITS